MKRTFWIGLCLAPVLLIGGAFWARKAAWEKMEDSYRRDLVAHAVKYSGLPGVNVMLNLNKGHRDQMHILTGWSQSELRAVAADIHLVRRMPGDWAIKHENNLQFVGYNYVFVVSLAGDRGEFIRAGERSDDELRTVALSPATCRMLKKRVWAQCSETLRQFHVAPPQ